MNPILFGLVAGTSFGLVAVGSMLPMQFQDKPVALAAAFCSRFAIGFLIPLCKLPLPPAVTGVVVALLVSLPDAIITKAYAPILGLGITGGAVIGWLAGRYVA
ncbi:MAG: hypothetical protein JWQ07_3080 [Ramlibacter sp.]|nr:hypothetical protein [Ramlibacter sp.]